MIQFQLALASLQPNNLSVPCSSSSIAVGHPHRFRAWGAAERAKVRKAGVPGKQR